jgi:uncharacterized membrane protein
MQAINVAVINRWFLAPLLGGAALGVVLLVAAPLDWAGAGALVYLVGTIGVTRACNIPRNDALAAVAPEAAGELWARYLVEWTRWNHVRTAAALVACALEVVAYAARV